MRRRWHRGRVRRPGGPPHSPRGRGRGRGWPGSPAPHSVARHRHHSRSPPPPRRHPVAHGGGASPVARWIAIDDRLVVLVRRRGPRVPVLVGIVRSTGRRGSIELSLGVCRRPGFALDLGLPLVVHRGRDRRRRGGRSTSRAGLSGLAPGPCAHGPGCETARGGATAGRAAAAPPAISAAVNNEREPEVRERTRSPTDAEAELDAGAAAVEPDDADDDRDRWAAPPHEDDEPVILSAIHRASWAHSPRGRQVCRRGPGEGRNREVGAGWRARPRIESSRTSSATATRPAASRGVRRTAWPAESPASATADARAVLVVIGRAVGRPRRPSRSRRGTGLAGRRDNDGRGREPHPAPPLTRQPPSGAYPTTSAAGRRPTVSATRARSCVVVVHHGRAPGATRRTRRSRRGRAFPGCRGSPCWVAPWRGRLGALLPAGSVGRRWRRGRRASLEPPRVPFGRHAPVADDPPPGPSRPPPQTYTIKKDDTLNKIAKKFDADLERAPCRQQGDDQERGRGQRRARSHHPGVVAGRGRSIRPPSAPGR